MRRRRQNNTGTELEALYSLLNQRSGRCTVYRFPPAAARWAAFASPVRPLLPRRQHLPAARTEQGPDKTVRRLWPIGHFFAYEDLVKSGFGGEHTESNHRLM